jgi:hypothetical protein
MPALKISLILCSACMKCLASTRVLGVMASALQHGHGPGYVPLLSYVRSCSRCHVSPFLLTERSITLRVSTISTHRESVLFSEVDTCELESE